MPNRNLPSPTRLSEIKSLVQKQEEKHPKLFGSFDRYSVESIVFRYLTTIGFGERKIVARGLESKKSSLLDAYSIHRAGNQLNEACNKLWSTVELANMVSPSVWKKCYSPLGEDFSGDFSLGTLIPTLYYSQVSTVISILSSFGCISIRDDEKGMSYNLVRTSAGWKIFPRNDYIRDVLSMQPSRSWHSQIMQLVSALSPKVLELPKIDLIKTRKLQRQRNVTHYDILGSVSAKPVMGIGRYFNFLPLVVNTINMAFATLKEAYGLTVRTGAERFLNLHSNLRKLYESYAREFPRDMKLVSFKATDIIRPRLI